MSKYWITEDIVDRLNVVSRKEDDGAGLRVLLTRVIEAMEELALVMADPLGEFVVKINKIWQ